MKRVSIRNCSRPQPGPLAAVYCHTFWCRLRGLTFRRSLPLDQGLLLVERRDSRMDASIHMLGVWFDLGIVWINAAYQVVDTCLARRWRPAYVPKAPARYILEIHPQRLPQFQVGDQVSFDEIPNS